VLPAPVTDLREPLPLFVYGTLTDPVFTRNLLEHPVSAVEARLPGFETVYFPGLAYPTVLQSDDGTSEGRLYRGLGEEDFRRLDAYEGVGEGLYQRVRVLVEATDRGDSEPAWVYLATGKTISRLTRG
jgi:gamma-glutamylcyclotransferase (GGCT)/AIG2-like uncharacterized protein YtfP